MKHPRIALFGGTFDPIHVGHVRVAACALERLDAEKLIFVPAKRSPLKGFAPSASDEDRLAMIRIATATHERFKVSDWELVKSAPSYTLDTVRHFRAQYGPSSHIHWLLGADSVDDLVQWRQVEQLLDECVLSVMYRGGFAQPDFSRFESMWGPRRVEKLRRNVVQTPLVDVSSTEIRARLSAGEDVSGQLDPGVWRYIHDRGLYASGSSR